MLNESLRRRFVGNKVMGLALLSIIREHTEEGELIGIGSQAVVEDLQNAG